MTVNRKTIPGLIEKREAFTNASGTLRATKNPQPVVRQFSLNDEEFSRLRIDQDQSGISYMVYSYDTPIAWETKTGHIYKVQQTFSQTTSKHQGLLYLFHERINAYAVCDRHLAKALGELIPQTNTSRIFRVSRYDGESEIHNCFCGKSADWFFRSTS